MPMTLQVGSMTKGGLYIERWLHPGGDESLINGAWLVKVGETGTCHREPGSPAAHQHGWPIGTIAPTWMLVRLDWTGEVYDRGDPGG